MYRPFFSKLLAPVLALALLVPAAGAQTTIDYDQMDRDLRIMEKVLGTVLDEEDISGFFRASKIKGVYLEPYGVVFMMNMSSRSHSGEKAVKAKETFDLLREELNGFLLDYTGVIKQLKPGDWITIVANASGTSGYYVGYADIEFDVVTSVEKKELFKPYSFIMSVKKSGVDGARKANMSVGQFADRVSFTPIGAGSEKYVSEKMHRDITIMTTIMETALEEKLDESFSRDSFQGTYLKGYGVLFTVNPGNALSIRLEPNYIFRGGSFGSSGVIEVLRDKKGVTTVKVKDLEKEIDQKIAEIKAKSAEEKKKQKEEEKKIVVGVRPSRIYSLEEKDITDEKAGERVKNLIQGLTEAIGDYGHTIRDMQPDEQIAVLFTSSSRYWGGSGGAFNLMLTVAYRDVLAYSRGNITLEAFKEKVTATTFK